MSTHSTSAPDLPNAATGNHQEDGIEFGAIMKIGAGLAVVTAASYLIVWGMFTVLVRQTDAVSQTRLYPLAIGQENRLPPEPRLQTTPKQDLRDLRAAEAATLNGYSWVDRNAGVVRIPIDSAMKLTIARGLPTRAAGTDQGK
jgi:hypothetical protein